MPSLQLSVPGQDTTLVMARASDSASPMRSSSSQTLCRKPFGDVAQDEVLLLGGAGASAGVAAHDVGDGAELRAVQVAALGLDHDGVVALLPLRFHVGLAPPAELFGRADAVGSGRYGPGFPQQFVNLHVGRGVDGANLFQLGVHHIAEFVEADAVYQHLEAGHHPVLAQHIGVVEHRPDGESHPQVVVGRDELVQRFGQPGHDGGAAAAEHLEATLLHAVHHANLRHVGQVLDGCRHVVAGVGTGEGGLELAREALGDGVAHAEADVGRQVGRGVEDLVGVNAGVGRANHVADGVAASLAAGQSHHSQQPQHIGTLGQRDVVELDVLAGSNVALAQRGILVRHLAQALHGLRGEDAAGNLDADHLHVRLALTVHALPQTEGGERGVVQLAGLKVGGLFLQPHHLFVHERDDCFRRLGKLQTVVMDVLQGALLARGLRTQALLPDYNALKFDKEKARRIHLPRRAIRSTCAVRLTQQTTPTYVGGQEQQTNAASRLVFTGVIYSYQADMSTQPR